MEQGGSQNMEEMPASSSPSFSHSLFLISINLKKKKKKKNTHNPARPVSKPPGPLQWPVKVQGFEGPARPVRNKGRLRFTSLEPGLGVVSARPGPWSGLAGDISNS
ncbi:hypothetical protein RND81_08G070500 [Saponaria officinalis]|uniref:Uncharacterized protein n=1 Tax=Saponaria officinalis TaxID=3572 RepID=A0AAW1J5A4_SAPOF